MKTNGMVLDRILVPVGSALNKQAAERIVRLKADRKTLVRVNKLADKCTEGKLTADERREYETYLIANHVIAILKAQAQIVLSRNGRRS